MARQARGQLIDPSDVQVVHCVRRCVRRTYLCGIDAYSGNFYEHRREWLRPSGIGASGFGRVALPTGAT